MNQRDAERIVIQCARRVHHELSKPVSLNSVPVYEALGELRNAVANLEEAEKPSRWAAQKHTEGGDW